VHQEVLRKDREAKLKVYAVWFNMVSTDERSKWPKDVLTDSRVVHFWDEGRVAGRWYEQNVTRRGEPVEWDAYFLYGPEAAWGEEPPKHVSSGRPIIFSRDRFRDDLSKLMKRLRSGGE
jgi:hypothetical protein